MLLLRGIFPLLRGMVPHLLLLLLVAVIANDGTGDHATGGWRWWRLHSIPLLLHVHAIKNSRSRAFAG